VNVFRISSMNDKNRRAWISGFSKVARAAGFHDDRTISRLIKISSEVKKAQTAPTGSLNTVSAVTSPFPKPYPLAAQGIATNASGTAIPPPMTGVTAPSPANAARLAGSTTAKPNPGIAHNIGQGIRAYGQAHIDAANSARKGITAYGQAHINLFNRIGQGFNNFRAGLQGVTPQQFQAQQQAKAQQKAQQKVQAGLDRGNARIDAAPVPGTPPANRPQRAVARVPGGAGGGINPRRQARLDTMGPEMANHVQKLDAYGAEAQRMAGKGYGDFNSIYSGLLNRDQQLRYSAMPRYTGLSGKY
jgi:hypothetical protein